MMADPNLEDLAELAPFGQQPGADNNPYAELLRAGAPAFLAKVSDSMREVLGELGVARRRIEVQKREFARLSEVRAKDLAVLERLAELHRLPTYGTEAAFGGERRCVGCRRKWPCKTARILGVDE